MAQIIKLLDSHTKENVNYEQTQSWHDGTEMNDEKCDGVIYRKKRGLYYRRAYSSSLNVKWFGAIGNNSNDDTIAFKKAIAFLKNMGTGKLYIPTGNYVLSDTLSIELDGIQIQGDGSKNSILRINHNNAALKYTSIISDLSISKFDISQLGIINIVNDVSFPNDTMKGIGVLCSHMHSSLFYDVYIENFLDALILEESYLNSFINYFSQSNYRGVKTVGGSNGNTFYNGVIRNSSLDLRGVGSERNLFINIDIEPASNTQYVGNNNTFQNCRFERFNLLHADFKKTWFVLDSKNKFINCDWHWNYADQPQDYMMIIEGEGNRVEIGDTNTTAKLILLKATSKYNMIDYRGSFRDYQITGSVRYSDYPIQDCGLGNEINFSPGGEVSKIMGDYDLLKIGKFNNKISGPWYDNVTINMNTMSIVETDIHQPGLYTTEQSARKIEIVNDNYVRRFSILSDVIADRFKKYSASAWIYIPAGFDGTYVSISIIEGMYIPLFMSNDNKEKWVRVFGYSQPPAYEPVGLHVDTDALSGYFYFSFPILCEGLSPV
ncbi:glycosyl hydrolase family 28-related protein [Limibacterium fermenti]|uniref:glycosyl hydrolase family 28-related protein n=1 Tax=Limibacterium fermenti TaxID=3229863 RepID=UPI002680D4C3